METMAPAGLEMIATETAEWIAADLMARAERESECAARYRTAAVRVRNRAPVYGARARRAVAAVAVVV